MKHLLMLSALILLGCGDSDKSITGSDGKPITGLMATVQGKYISANGRLQMTFRGDSARIRGFPDGFDDELRFNSPYAFQIDGVFEMKDTVDRWTRRIDTVFVFDDYVFYKINADSSWSRDPGAPAGWGTSARFIMQKSGDSIKTNSAFGFYVVNKAP